MAFADKQLVNQPDDAPTVFGRRLRPTPYFHWCRGIHGGQIPGTFEDDTLAPFNINGEQVQANARYFPFWDWYIVSFVFEKDYRSPIHTSHRIIYLSAFCVFVAVFATLLIVLPLKRLVAATEGVSDGSLFRIDKITDN